jgi:alpha-1,6-mannosyltransferase
MYETADERPRSTDLPGFARAEAPSLVVGGLVGLYFLVVRLRLPWESDFALHMAVLGRLLTNPLHPGDPVLAIGGTSAYYTPYTVVLMLIGKATGASALSLYKFAAIVNVGLLLTGLFRFVRSLSPARWAPPLALVGLLFWWGTTVIAWSGFLSLVSFADTVAYPSTFATALTLHLWASLAAKPLRMRRAIALGFLLGVIALSHQFTAIGTLIGVVACLIARRGTILRGTQANAESNIEKPDADASRGASYRRVLTVGAPFYVGAAVCLIVIAAWPYYHLWNITQVDQLSALDGQHHALYRHATAWYGFGLLALIALALRFLRDKTDQLVLLFLGTGAIVAYGAVSGHWSYGRSWPMAMLAAQVALAIAAAEARTPRLRVAWDVPIALITAAGVWVQSSALLYVVPSSLKSSASRIVDTSQKKDPLPTLDWLGAHVKRGDVVLADRPTAQDMVAAHGGYGVASPWILPDFPFSLWTSRRDAVARFFASDATPAAHADLLTRYDVKWILLGPGENLPADVTATFSAGDNLGYRLYRVG